ncbi:MAG: hypothetical protein L3K18_09565 [Thermoplasmata archaeon]|nr:hypothetical protein [Thermoplasmata archaeon]
MKPLLLWTERPVRLAREEPTHAFMERERPWEIFDLELVFDNRPGGWPHYAQIFQECWERGRRERRSLIVLESDVVPTIDSFRQLLECHERVCMVPYLNGMLGETPRYGTVIETRVPGGWHSRFGEDGDEWAVDGDLGLVRFRPDALLKPWPGDINATGHTAQGILINTALFRALRGSDPRGTIHCHYPAMVNSHVYWDGGDLAHHPTERWAEMNRVHARWLDPTLQPR